MQISTLRSYVLHTLVAHAFDSVINASRPGVQVEGEANEDQESGQRPVGDAEEEEREEDPNEEASTASHPG